MLTCLRAPFFSSLLAALTFAVLLVPAPVQAACGCMMGRKRPPPKPNMPQPQRAKIVNKSSKVILVRDGDRTVLTMANDVGGDIREFALIVPVPTAITKNMVKVADYNVFSELEDVTAPKLKELIDPIVCPVPRRKASVRPPSAKGAGSGMADGSARKEKPRAKDFGIKVEDHFKVGEYDIAILKATESDGLIRWLKLFKYDVPDEAAAVLQSYIKQDMRFFVTRVDLGKQKREGFTMLRPLQISFNTPKFTLPIRLGMVNADGPQELMVYGVSPRGRIEPVNYRAVKMPTDLEFPYFVKSEFTKLYEAGFTQQTNVNEMKSVLIEYVGPTWRKVPGNPFTMAAPTRKGVNMKRIDPAWHKRQGSKDAYVTRMHFRYDQQNFPEDLKFQQTDDTLRFSLNYTVRKELAAHQTKCAAGKKYLETLPARHDVQAKTLAAFAGMPESAVRKRMGLPEKVAAVPVDDVGTPDTGAADSTAPEEATAEGLLGCASAGGGTSLGALALVFFIRSRRRRRG